MKPFAQKTVWIVGASSGIGLATAQALYAQGANLILSARREKDLEEICRSLGGRAHHYALDMEVSGFLNPLLEKMRRNHPRLDTVLYFPAFYQPGPIASMTDEDMARAVHLNLLRAMVFARDVAAFLDAQGGGQLALCASFAGYTGLPQGQPYSATKAGLINFTESLRAENPLLDVKVINPGFVKTPMTAQNTFSMPMIISPERAAHFVIKGLLKSHFEIAFPSRFRWMMKCLRFMPYALYFYLTRRM